ncbi:MAG: poly(3-hydroxyalkanoate) synthetase, partial [Hyphomicrobiales bacterium]|nr:poly(3-hydroxyalkanoate) synthetase [Hyphomicrobiales bacterium]
MSPNDMNKSGGAARFRGFSLPSVPEDGGDWIKQFSECLSPRDTEASLFASANEIYRVLPTMRLRVFGARKRRNSGATTLIVAPFAAQDATMVDLMRGHSLVEVLCNSGDGTVYLTDWKSATPDMRHLSIDTYLSDLNVVIDDLGGDVNVVGLCQGGWLALLHAARFPGKIKRLVLAGTPVDVSARPSSMTRFVAGLPLGKIDEIGTAEAGIVDGCEVLSALGAGLGHERAAIETLQRNPASFSDRDMRAITTYEKWTRHGVQLPGVYCQQMLTWLFRENRLALGTFEALGQIVDLKRVRIPIFVLCGKFDDVTPKDQALSVLALVGTGKARVRSLVATCGHYALFVGATTLTREWTAIASWLSSPASLGKFAAEKKVAAS